jgi:YhcH/YjgK/YiaL family protein
MALADAYAHRKMIDIQLVLAGNETMGWKSREDCRIVQQTYDPGRDIEFFDDPPTTWIEVPPIHFCIFFPSDAHAPLAGVGAVRKAIAKVAVDW